MLPDVFETFFMTVADAPKQSRDADRTADMVVRGGTRWGKWLGFPLIRTSLMRPGLAEGSRSDGQARGPETALFEYWRQEASLMPPAMQPLFRWRMAWARAEETWTGSNATDQ